MLELTDFPNPPRGDAVAAILTGERQKTLAAATRSSTKKHKNLSKIIVKSVTAAAAKTIERSFFISSEEALTPRKEPLGVEEDTPVVKYISRTRREARLCDCGGAHLVKE